MKGKLRILNAEALGYSAEARNIIQAFGELNEAQLDRGGLIRQVPNFEVLIVRLGHRIDAEIMNAAANLRAIVSATTGLDHIDLEEAKKRGIEVLSLRGEKDFLARVSATAEHTWGLLLALVRQVTPAFDHVRNGHWDRDHFVGRSLADRNLGVVGYGRLGRMVTRYGLAFGMNVRVTDINPPRENLNVRTCGLDELICECDV